jgi:hypothetical protein
MTFALSPRLSLYWAQAIPRLQIAWGRIALAAILVAVCVLHLPTLDDPFYGDDYVAFTEFKAMGFFDYTKAVFLFEDANFYWRPLGVLFHRLLYEVFGLDPFTFRLAGLALFAATVACIYAFCVREKLGVWVGLGAALSFAILPSHVVSVAWVTNASRLLALLLLLVCLLLLQESRRRPRLLYEAAAWLAFLAAALSDETTLALAPLPVVYMAYLGEGRFAWRPALARAAAYGALVVTLVPLQLANSIDDEPRLAVYGFGPHVVSQGWALISQLVLPITTPLRGEVLIEAIEPAQWAAGLAAATAGCLLFLLGPRQARFLVLWTALSLAPFALWGVLYTSPRYVYMAAAPYAILFAWGAVQAAGFALQTAAAFSGWQRVVRPCLVLAIAVAVATGAYVGSEGLEARNEAWGRDTARWGVLSSALQRAVPEPPPGARIVILEGDWADLWATALARSVYGDPALRVSVISKPRVDAGRYVLRKDDIVLLREGNLLIPRGGVRP